MIKSESLQKYLQLLADSSIKVTVVVVYKTKNGSVPDYASFGYQTGYGEGIYFAKTQERANDVSTRLTKDGYENEIVLG